MEVAIELNLLAILVAALSAFLVGGLWYSPLLFASPWMRASGVSEEQVNTANKATVFGLSFVFLFIMALCLAMFLNDPSVNLATGALYGFLTGFGWLFFAFGVVALFEQRPWQYILINGGYWVVAMTLMGLILGAWH